MKTISEQIDKIIPKLRRRYSEGRANASGAYSNYYQFKKIGAKVFCSQWDSQDMMLENDTWQTYQTEFELLKKAEKSGFTPKAYELRAIKIGDEWMGVIFMEHISGKTFAKCMQDNAKLQDIKCRVQAELVDNLSKTVGIIHCDLHFNNIIVNKQGKKNKYYAIDFSPDYTTESG